MQRSIQRIVRWVASSKRAASTATLETCREIRLREARHQVERKLRQLPGGTHADVLQARPRTTSSRAIMMSAPMLFCTSIDLQMMVDGEGAGSNDLFTIWRAVLSPPLAPRSLLHAVICRPSG